jgi:mannose-1-phosphate guanylyltransferase
LRAIILAAGYGSRLKPLTLNTPKCLVKINNQPLLEIWLNKLNECGVKNFLINLHYLSDEVENFVNKSKFKKRIKLVYEKKLLGTAGTLKKNIDFFKNDGGFLLHSDNLCKENLNKFIEAHNNRPKKCLLTLMSFKTSQPKNCGILKTYKKVLINYEEKPKHPKSNLANGALYFLTNQFLINFKKSDFFSQSQDFSRDIIPRYLNQIYTYKTKKLFIDIGNIKTYEKYKDTIL